MIKALQQGITTLGRTVTGLDNTNLFYQQAKHSADLPYCVFQDTSGDEFNYDSNEQYETAFVQFAFYDTNLSNLQTLANNFKSVFDFGESSLSVTGYSVVRMDRILSTAPAKQGKAWQIVLEYSIEIQKSRS